jgi:hypothetical protein
MNPIIFGSNMGFQCTYEIKSFVSVKLAFLVTIICLRAAGSETKICGRVSWHFCICVICIGEPYVPPRDHKLVQFPRTFATTDIENPNYSARRFRSNGLKRHIDTRSVEDGYWRSGSPKSHEVGGGPCTRDKFEKCL